MTFGRKIIHTVPSLLPSCCTDSNSVRPAFHAKFDLLNQSNIIQIQNHRASSWNHPIFIINSIHFHPSSSLVFFPTQTVDCHRGLFSLFLSNELTTGQKYAPITLSPVLMLRIMLVYIVQHKLWLFKSWRWRRLTSSSWCVVVPLPISWEQNGQRSARCHVSHHPTPSQLCKTQDKKHMKASAHDLWYVCTWNILYIN